MKRLLILAAAVSLSMPLMADKHHHHDDDHDCKSGVCDHKKGHHDDHEKRRGMSGRILSQADELAMTKDQVKQVEKIHDSFKKKKRNIAGELKDIRHDLHKLITGKTADQGKINSLLDRHDKLFREYAANSLEERNAVLGVLTKEQREKISY